MAGWTDELSEQLGRLDSEGRLRRLLTIDGPNAARTRAGRKTLLNFSSNNYLGLAQHPRVRSAAAAAARRWGAGSGASRLISGTLAPHVRLETALARWKKEEAALVYSSGYLANLGTIPALVGPGDLVVLDRLDHASLVDGARLSRAKLWVYPHLDASALDALLRRAAGRFRRKLVVTDSYFSMDGHVAPLDRLSEVCRSRDAMLYVDEAHATGVYGARGEGLTGHFGLEGRIDVVMGTLSKALGSVGGYVAGKRVLADWLVNRSRAFVYTTAPAPAASAAAHEAIALVRRGTQRRRLWELTFRLRRRLSDEGFDLMGSEGPVIPIRLGSTRKAGGWSEYLLSRGIYAPVIRPPTVPEGTDRLRVSVTAAHAPADLDRFVEALVAARRTLG